MRSIHRYFAENGFVRDTSDKILGGVCSGLARKFGVDAWAVRVLFIATLLLLPGSQILIYPVVWVLMPDEARAAEVRQQAPAGVLNNGANVPQQPTAAYQSNTEPNTDLPKTDLNK